MEIRLLKLTLMYLIFSTDATAQFVGFGVTPGGNAAQFINSEQSLPNNPSLPADQGNKLGGNGGIKLEWMLFHKEWLKLSPEFYILQKGSKEYYSSVQQFSQSVVNRRIDLDYVGVMVPLKFEIKGTGTIFSPTPYGVTSDEVEYTVLYFQANFFGDLNIGARTSSGDQVTFDNFTDKIDSGFSAQVGLALNLNTFIQFGYNRGVKNVKFMTQNNTTQSTNAAYLINNRNFTISMVFTIPTSSSY